MELRARQCRSDLSSLEGEEFKHAGRAHAARAPARRSAALGARRRVRVARARRALARRRQVSVDAVPRRGGLGAPRDPRVPDPRRARAAGGAPAPGRVRGTTRRLRHRQGACRARAAAADSRPRAARGVASRLRHGGSALHVVAHECRRGPRRSPIDGTPTSSRRRSRRSASTPTRWAAPRSHIGSRTSWGCARAPRRSRLASRTNYRRWRSPSSARAAPLRKRAASASRISRARGPWWASSSAPA